jgi:hypothetical protein
MTDAREHGSAFRQLLGSKHHHENSLSAAFALCFRDSPTFRRTVLAVLSETCRSKRRRDADWHCRTEVAQTDGRTDIELHTDGALVYRLENKVQAPLTAAQMRKYRCGNQGEYLVAITKRPPEVGAAWFHNNGAFAVRWQDFHRALRSVRGKGVDDYLRSAFCDYLEELGMAHREDITTGDLNRLHRLLRHITRTKHGSLGVGSAFEVADSCAGILGDIMRRAVEEESALSKWSRHGPAYLKWQEGAEIAHHLCFRFHDRGWKRWVGAGFVFTEGLEPGVWRPAAMTQRRDYVEKTLAFKRISGSDGVLDQDKMLRSFLNHYRDVKTDL